MKISIVIPLLNEEEILPDTILRLLELKKTLHRHSTEMIFIDDGSTDNSLSILRNSARENSFIKVISFLKNNIY